MNKFQTLSAIALSMLFTSTAFAGNDTYEVTITNLTKSIFFTPIMVASHKQSVNLFELGHQASDEISAVAEGGDTSGLAALFTGNKDQVFSAGPLDKGLSVTVMVENVARKSKITIASMLLPTNDGFVARTIHLPRGNHSKTVYLRAYDAGTETNDENCMNIPGPQCHGAPFSPEDDGEGFVHIHSGIHGVGDLSAAMYTWNNPVLKVTINKVKKSHGDYQDDE
ncbi:MAG: spondin domain-containing protein [Thalassotalea sp.]